MKKVQTDSGLMSMEVILSFQNEFVPVKLTKKDISQRKEEI